MPPLTDAQQKVIKVRRRVIRQRLYGIFQRDPRYAICFAGRSRRSLGGAMRDRLCGFAKLGAFENGRLLLTYWTDIELELMRDPFHLGGQVLDMNALSRFTAAAWERHFYKMAMGDPEGIDANRLVPQRVTGMPGFGVVSMEAAERFLGYWGGTPVSAPPAPTPPPTPPAEGGDE